ncbi:hypothetical protein [Microcystis phage Mwe-JY05]
MHRAGAPARRRLAATRAATWLRRRTKARRIRPARRPLVQLGIPRRLPVIAPAGRRPAGTFVTAPIRPTAGPTTTRERTVMSEMQGPTEAVEQWAHGYEPENAAGHASAEKMLRTLSGIADHTESTADAYKLVADKITDRIAFDGGTADLVHQVETQQRRLVEPIRELQAQIEQVHADQLDRIRNGDPNTAAWDWRANQPDVLT